MQSTHNIEIERKFLVAGDFKPFVSAGFRITQGYLCSAPDRTVRIRVKGDRGFITIKGKSGDNGFSRFEWEKEITFDDATQLLALCDTGVIDKIRYEVPFEGKVFEVDVFEGENEGLVMAELELQSEEEQFTKPAWLGREVTGDRRYYNSYLSQHPFREWANNQI